jgi:hypothetical protein
MDTPQEPINDNQVTCPRCLGKGFVDDDDIKRLNHVGEWLEGTCAYCDGIGIVDKEKLSQFDPADITLVDSQGKVEDTSDYPQDFEAFIKFFKKRVCPHFVFRGVSDFNFTLKSKICRRFEESGIKDEETFLEKEETLIEIFKAKAISHVGMQQLTEWQWIVLAQHYGLSTRILDWTENPLIALYFASLSNPDRDGAIYAWHFTEALHLSDHTPLKTKHSGFFIPPYLTNRIIAQSSIFSITTKPWKELQDDFPGTIKKLRITKEFKHELLEILPRLGISRRTIFADLDSYATDIDDIFNSKKCFSKGSFSIAHCNCS